MRALPPRLQNTTLGRGSGSGSGRVFPLYLAMSFSVVAGVTMGRIEDPAAAALVVERAVVGAAIDCVIGTKVVPEAAAKAALQTMVVRFLLGS